MLQFFRDNMQGMMAKIIIAIIIVPFALFGVESFISSSGANDAASVNGEPVSISELTRAMQVRKSNMLAQMGENADPSSLSDDMIRGPVLESLIQQQLIRQTASDLDLAVGDTAIDANIVSTESFQIDGKFSAERYRSLLSSNGLTPLAYKQLLQDDLKLRQLMDGITSSSFISKEELAVAARFVGETRTIEFMTLPMADALQNAMVTEQEVQTYYDENPSQFMTEESVSLEYILVNRDDFSPEISDEDVRAEYQRQIDNMAASVSRGAAHIMLELGDRSEADAIAQLQQIKAELDAGADFAALAAKYSDDSYSAQEGGDIGDTTGDVFPPEFESALQGLALNEVSDPVVTEGSVHLIKLVRLQTLEKPTLEEKYAEIKAQLAVVEAEPLYIQTLEQLADMSFNSVGLQDTAEELKLTLTRSDKLTRRGAGGVFGNEKLLKAAFSDELLSQGHNSEVIEISPQQSIVVRVAEHFPSVARPLQEVASDITNRLKNRAATEALETQAKDIIEQLKAGASLSDVASRLSLQAEQLANVNRREPQQPRLVNAAFAMPVSDVAYQTVSLGMQGTAIIKVSDVRPGDLATMNAVEAEGLRAFLIQSSASADLAAFQASLRANADVKLL